jgi:hypothetical protein
VRHFIQYHNAERYGPASPELVIHTSKPPDKLLGHVVWLIVGQGHPRQYGLGKMFVVDDVGPLTVDDFRYYVRGAEGRRFDPPRPLSGLAWFPALLRSQANFSLGVRELRQGAFIAALEQVAAEPPSPPIG